MTDSTNTTSSSHQPTPRLISDPAEVNAAERLLAEVRAEIGRADTKASVLIGALGACAGVVLTTYWSKMPTTGFSRTLGVASGLTWALALGFLLFATAPRYRMSQWRTGSPLTYFLDIRRAAGSGVLADALRTTQENQLSGLVIALRNTSDIVAAKHRWIRTGLVCFLLGALALGGSMLAAV
ncbi:Pycsar system effector family protein [Streptomyces sp. NPDC057539]|uniref:Pycsar system effector family protein n=1 Tax=Streptomyces sp. NPDC057539 TaxID=3346159 RepID=UPI0036C96048